MNILFFFFLELWNSQGLVFRLFSVMEEQERVLLMVIEILASLQDLGAGWALNNGRWGAEFGFWLLKWVFEVFGWFSSLL